MLELVKAGGWPMVPLIVAGVIALAIIFERLWSLRRSQVLPPGLGEEVRRWFIRGNLMQEHIQSLRHNSPLGMVLAKAIEMQGKPRDHMRERIEDTGRYVSHNLERFLMPLGTIASAGPLLGLLGTVIGMIEMFMGILSHGLGDVSQLAGGIGKALVCTATGMVIAIPSLLFYRYFKARIAQHVISIEQEVALLVDVIENDKKMQVVGKKESGKVDVSLHEGRH